MRKQVKFSVQIGFTAQDLRKSKVSLASAEVILAKAVSRVCGGCETHTSNGWWCEDGATHKATFDGKLQQEISLNLSVSCEQHKEKETLEAIQYACKCLKERAKLNFNWVHCSRSEFVGMHFDVDKVGAMVDTVGMPKNEATMAQKELDNLKLNA